MPTVEAFLTGFGLGFLVGAQVGPIWLLCLRSTLRSGFAVGAAIGAGAALVDTLYAAAGIAGASAALEIDALRIGLGLVGAGVLAWLGARSLWTAFRVRLGGEALEEVASPRRAFLTATVATASNPLTIVSWAAIFSAASTASVVDSAPSAFAMLVGVGAGSLAWFLLLSSGLAFARRRVGPRLLRIVEGVSGVGLLGFAGVLGYRTLRA
jgi:putative LysE/RhtB family amino acid efflux pump